MEFLKNYWPGLLGAILLGFFGVRVLSAPEPPKAVAVLEPSAEERARFEKSSQRPKDEGQTIQPAASAAPLPEPPKTSVLREKLIIVPSDEQQNAPKTYTQDSPEVQRALGQVKVEVYATQDDPNAPAALEYLKSNGLNFATHDASDAAVEEQVRRLTNSPVVQKDEGIVIVVDGQVLRGFSDEQMQSAITAAVKNRVSAAP